MLVIIYSVQISYTVNTKDWYEQWNYKTILLVSYIIEQIALHSTYVLAAHSWHTCVFFYRYYIETYLEGF